MAIDNPTTRTSAPSRSPLPRPPSQVGDLRYRPTAKVRISPQPAVPWTDPRGTQGEDPFVGNLLMSRRSASRAVGCAPLDMSRIAMSAPTWTMGTR